MDKNEKINQLHRMYAMRVAMGCILGAMPPDQRQKATAAMGQHILCIEEAHETGNFPGAEQMAKVMSEEFDALQRAASVVPSFVMPTVPLKKPRTPRKKSA